VDAYVSVLPTRRPPTLTLPVLATIVACRSPPRLDTTGGSANAWLGLERIRLQDRNEDLLRDRPVVQAQDEPYGGSADHHEHDPPDDQ
jgi:hypothetical protein